MSAPQIRKPDDDLAFLWPNDVRVQLPLAASDVSLQHISSKNNGGHSRAKAPLVPPAFSMPKRRGRPRRSASEPDVSLWAHPAPRSFSDCHSYPQPFGL